MYPQEKVDNKQDAYDDMILADLNLDNQVRTLHESSKQYDRDNPGANVLIQIFPDGTFSHIVKTSRTKEQFAAAIREQKIAEAEEEIAQANLRCQYEANYLDASKQLGHRAADSLFPQNSRGRTIEETEIEAAPSEE